MLSNTVTIHGSDWDEKLLYILFAYRPAAQESTQESPFFLVYGCDLRLPTETALSALSERSLLELGEYEASLVHNLTRAWETGWSKQSGTLKRSKRGTMTRKLKLFSELVTESSCIKSERKGAAY